MSDGVASMTGFARVEGKAEGAAWAWEVRSVNGRGLDVRLRAPSFIDQAERAFRQEATARFKRGSIQATLNLERDETAAAPRVDMAALQSLIDDLGDVKLVADGPVAPARLDGLLQVRGVMASSAKDDADEALRAAPLADIPQLLERLQAARLEEGARLAAVLDRVLDEIADLAGRAREIAGRQPEALAKRYRETIERLLGEEIELPEERIAQEAAALAVKADVAEELDRLAAHVAQAKELLAAGGPVGRRLDFLAQEFNREANTLGSKSADLELTRLSMDLKASIDAFREQAQNIE